MRIKTIKAKRKTPKRKKNAKVRPKKCMSSSEDTEDDVYLAQICDDDDEDDVMESDICQEIDRYREI